MTWAMQAILESSCHGTLEIDDHSMNRPAFASLNNFVLWNPANVIGDDLVIPHRDGVLALRRRRTVTKRTLNLLIVGQVDVNGDPTDDPLVGLEDNCAWLDEFVYAPVVSSSGLREAVLTLPSGATRSGGIHIESVEYGSTVSGALTANMEISLPYGQLGPATGS